MKKKLLSLVMACAMALSLAAPAFAGYFNHTTEQNTLTPDGIVFSTKVHVPTIKLTMPDLSTTDGAAPVVLNPYKLGYSGSDNKVNDVAVGNAGDGIKQIISPVYAIKNQTNVALKFDIKASTEKGTSAAFDFATAHVGLKEKNKKVFAQLVVKKTEFIGTLPATTAAQELDPFDTAVNEVVVLAVGDKTTSTSGVRKLAAVDATNTTNYLEFQFQGSMSRTPDVGWTTDDTFATTLTFTFTPEGAQDYVATVDDISVGTSTQKPTADLGDDVKIKLDTAYAAFTNNTATFKTLKTGANTDAKKQDGTTTTAIAKDLAGTTPAWELISAGAFGATINASSGEITYPKSMGKTLTGSGTGSAPASATAKGNNVDSLVIGFNDYNGVPRTIGVTVKIAYTTSAS